MAKKAKVEEVDIRPEWINKPTAIGDNMWLPGNGPMPAKFMFIVDRPSIEEQRQGACLAGKLGELWRGMAMQHGFDIQDAYVTYAVKYRSRGKNVKVPEITECNRMLMEEIKRVHPTYIVPLGRVALTALLEREDRRAISEYRGALFEHPKMPGTWVYPSFSLAHVALDPARMPEFHLDWANIKQLQTKGKLEFDKTEVIVINTIDDLRYVIDTILAQDFVPLSIDCEWHGKHWMDPDRFIRTVQFSDHIGMGIVVELVDENQKSTFDRPDLVWGELKRLFEAPNVGIVGHNALADAEWLAPQGINIIGRVMYDTMLAEHTINADGSFGLDACAIKYTTLGKYDQELLDWKREHGHDVKGYLSTEYGYGRIPRDILIPYGATDVDAPLRVMAEQLSHLAVFDEPRGLDGEYPSLWATVMATQASIMEIEVSGMRVDQHRLGILTKVFTAKRDQLEGLLNTKALELGMPVFNFRSTDDVRKVMFDILKLPPVKTTDDRPWEKVMDEADEDAEAAVASTDKVVLEILQESHPFVKILRDARKIDQFCKVWLRSDYDPELYDEVSKGGGIVAKIWPDGKVHARFSQLKETGRFSSSKPNCFPGWVELLTEIGWVKFSELGRATRVAQYDTVTGVISLATPDAHVRYNYTGELLEWATSLFISAVATPDHRMWIRNRKSGTCAFRALASLTNPSEYTLTHAGSYEGGSVDMPEAQLAVIAALQADGSFVAGGGIDWGFSKARKWDRLAWALTACKIPFKVTPHQKNGKTYHRFYVGKHAVPAWLWDKKFFGPWIMQLSQRAFRLLANEIWFWDGCWARKSMYASKTKENADWVLILTALTGRRAKLRLYAPRPGVVSWQVDASRCSRSHTANSTLKRVAHNGLVYCVTMPKGTIIVRCNPVKAPLIVGQCQNFPKKTEGDIRRIFKHDK